MKTSELTGNALNWAVNYAEGLRGIFAPVDYSGDWAQGGPIIDREKISLVDANGCWAGRKAYWDSPKPSLLLYGPTPLIAAMRCYVASKLGDDVDVPELP